MKLFRILTIALALLSMAACSQRVSVNGTLEGASGSSVVYVKQLDGASYKVLDSLKVRENGGFSYTARVEKNQPEFFYFFYKDTKVASLLLDRSGSVSVQADTLGHYTVSGNALSEELCKVEGDYAAFINRINALVVSSASNADISRAYVAYYRDRVKYVMAHPGSLISVPILYQQINESTPVFGQTTDALYFRMVLDSLKTVYPESRYLAPLEKETARREQLLGIEQRLKTATQESFPDIKLPDMTGNTVALSSVNAKLILLYFWSPSDAAQKMFNFESLKPLYEQYKGKGFEIYAVGLDYDKVNWASSIRAQELGWINVFDGRGADSPSLRAYNIAGTPGGILIHNGEIAGPCISGEQELKREIARLL